MAKATMKDEELLQEEIENGEIDEPGLLIESYHGKFSQENYSTDNTAVYPVKINYIRSTK